MLDQDTLFTPQETADYCRLTKRWLEVGRYKGTGPPFIRIGNRVRYRLSDLRAFIEARRRTSTSDPGPGGGDV